MALISDGSVSPHKKCCFVPFLSSFGVPLLLGQSFSCRSKRDFNDVTEQWGDYVTLLEKESAALFCADLGTSHTLFSTADSYLFTRKIK